MTCGKCRFCVVWEAEEYFTNKDRKYQEQTGICTKDNVHSRVLFNDGACSAFEERAVNVYRAR